MAPGFGHFKRWRTLAVTLLLLQGFTVFFVYTYLSTDKVHYEQRNIERAADEINSDFRRTNRGLSSLGGSLGVRQVVVGAEPLSLEGEEIHLNIRASKVILHVNSDEFSDENLIRINEPHNRKQDAVIIHRKSRRSSASRSNYLRGNRLSSKDRGHLVLSKQPQVIIKSETKTSPIAQEKFIQAQAPEVNDVDISDVRVVDTAVRVETPGRTFGTKNDTTLDIEAYVEKYKQDCEQNVLHVNFRGLDQLRGLCPCVAPDVGKVPVDTKAPSMAELENFHPEMGLGGRWRPTDCVARQRIALIIPYRNREEHLRVFLQHILPFLQMQNLDISIFVIEQVNPATFNRASLMNIGYKEAKQLGRFDCYIFHDVDLLPEDLRNMYTCTTSPRHVAVAVDKFRYRLQYGTIVGGALAVTRDQMEKINGFSNKFFGWGGEDDDMYHRINTRGFKLERYPEAIARYTMLQHGLDKGNEPNPTGGVGLEVRREEYDVDGLTSLKYRVVKTDWKRLFTLVQVEIL